jgi:formylglycine-generating enzyme required for sulfatase activity
MTTSRPLRVFLCHSSADKPAVRELYQKLRNEPWIQPWLDEEELYPGQDWETEIEKAVESSDVVLVCLSNGSINKRGYVQKELRFALDVALEMPDETIFIVPLRLEECTPPRSLRDWQYADYFEGQRERAFQRLLVSLERRVDALGLIFEMSAIKEEKLLIEPPKTKESGMPTADWIAKNKITLSNGMEFMCIPAGEFIMGSDDGDDDEKPLHKVDLSYDYWIGRFPITYDYYGEYEKVLGVKFPVEFSFYERTEPVVCRKVPEHKIEKYCKWLNEQFREEIPFGYTFRLPTEAEWEKAARGVDGRVYPWGNAFDNNKCNVKETGNRHITPVNRYSPGGDSPYGCADMIGNVMEFTSNSFQVYPFNPRFDKNHFACEVRRGGCYQHDSFHARCSSRTYFNYKGEIDTNDSELYLDRIFYNELWTGFRLAVSFNLG